MTTTTVTLHGVTDTLKPEQSKYRPAFEAAVLAFRDAESIFGDPKFELREGWAKDETSDSGEVAYAKKMPDGPHMFTVQSFLNGQVDDIMKDIWTQPERLPNWNANIDFSHIVATLTDQIDILNYSNGDILLVTGREFVVSRIYRKIGDGYIVAARSVDLNEVPEHKGKVRGHVFLCAARLRPHPSDSSKTICDCVSHVDLKGNIPDMVVNQFAGKFALMEANENKKHFECLKRQACCGTTSPPQNCPTHKLRPDQCIY
ncbi:unnamed protein product, partial [Mesorhabditis belari]|uniref:START domain-containing protein n=1 Tax=Mesorhabditis belari TaxID=2138241 RepID=A0AAF3F2Z2_9BILA